MSKVEISTKLLTKLISLVDNKSKKLLVDRNSLIELIETIESRKLTDEIIEEADKEGIVVVK